MKAIGYVRVSTDRQERDGHGLDAQRSAIRAEAKRHGWKLLRIAQETASAETLRKRPVLRGLLDELGAGDANVLVVAKLARLSRSCVDGGAILERAKKKGWRLVVIDLGIDTSTPAGELVANVLISVGQWERREIGERTRDALAAAREKGVQLGRPPTMNPKTRARIRRLRTRGHSLRAIAERLNAEGVPTAHGGARWHPETVRKAL